MSSAPAKGQYETIEPPTNLRSKVRVLSKREAAQFDPVKRAEQAVERLSVNFSDWMSEEVERLVKLWVDAKDAHFEADKRAALYRAAHDLRGQASTLGYPTVGRIAGTFCDLLDEYERNDLPDNVLDAFVDAIRAISRETDRNQDNEIAQELADQLAEVADTVRSRG